MKSFLKIELRNKHGHVAFARDLCAVLNHVQSFFGLPVRYEGGLQSCPAGSRQFVKPENAQEFSESREAADGTELVETFGMFFFWREG